MEALADQASNDIGTVSDPEGFVMKESTFRFHLIRRALLHKKAKALLLILAVAMGGSVVTALLNLEFDLRSRMNRELRDYGPNVLLIPHLFKQRMLPASAQSILKDRDLSPIVIASTPELFVAGQLNGSQS